MSTTFPTRAVPVPDGPEMVLRLTRLLARQAPHQPLALRLCHAVVAAVEAREGAISLGLALHDRSVLCATSESAERFEDAQDVVREGPSLEAFATGHAVPPVGAVALRRRWPTLAAAVGGLVVGDVQALPMRPASTLVGVLTVHHAPGARRATGTTDLQFFADAVGAAIIGELPGLPVLESLGGLVEPRGGSVLWTDRDRVAQATGMVVAQLGLSTSDAMAVLRAHAFVAGTTLLEICRRVVARELDLSLSTEVDP